MSLPEPIIALLASFQPVFPHPTWQKAMVLLVGTVLAQGRRTVTVALRQMGLAKSPHRSQIPPLTQSSALVATTTEPLLAQSARRDIRTTRGHR